MHLLLEDDHNEDPIRQAVGSELEDDKRCFSGMVCRLLSAVKVHVGNTD